MHYNFPSFFMLQDIFTNEDLAIGFLIESGVILQRHLCVCGNDSLLNLGRRTFRCPKKNCRKEISMFTKTFFLKTSLKKNQILHLAYFWLCSGTSLSSEMYFGFSDKTIASYFKYFRELVADSLDDNNFRIGGQNVVVQIDESKFGLRKYHRGHRVDGVWVFGGVEMTSERKVFLVSVPDRSEETLLMFIERHVIPGSIIYSDMWRGYLNIESKLSLRHYTVNHSIGFVNETTGVNTNTIEGTWSGVKRRVPVRNRVASAIDLHLLEFVWRRNNIDDLWGAFIRALKDVQYDN